MSSGSQCSIRRSRTSPSSNLDRGQGEAVDVRARSIGRVGAGVHLCLPFRQQDEGKARQLVANKGVHVLLGVQAKVIRQRVGVVPLLGKVRQGIHRLAKLGRLNRPRKSS